MSNQGTVNVPVINQERNVRVICDECEGEYDSRGIGAHQMFTGHEGRTPVTKRNGKEIVKAQPVSTSDLFRRVDNFILLQDGDGNVWLAERIK